MKLEDIGIWHFFIAVVVFGVLGEMFGDYQKETTKREYIKNGFVQEQVNGKEIWIKKDIIKQTKNE